MKLSYLEMDALREIGNIGAGNAATVLSILLDRKIPMEVPAARLLPLGEVVDELGGAENEVVGVCAGVVGDAPCTILFLLPLARARYLVNVLLHREWKTDFWFDELEKSALGEVTNILTGAYLQALTEITKLSFIPTVPAFAQDMAGALIDSVLINIGAVADYVLLIESDFVIGEGELKGHFFLVPDPDSLNRILQALGVRS